MAAAAWFVTGGLLALEGANATVCREGRARIVDANRARPAEAALVLGAAVYPDGGLCSMLEDRLQTGLELYRAGTVPKLLVSGDHGTAEYDEVNPMRRWLEARGVPGEDVFMDHAGFNTYHSLYRARHVFQARRLIVVTQRFHLPRALFIADRLGMDAEGVAADRRRYAASYRIRETAARVKAFVEVLVGRRPADLGPPIPISGDGRATAG